MGRALSAVALAAALLACCIAQGAARLNATAAAEVVKISAANPTVQVQAGGIVQAVQQKLLINTLTGNLNVKGLAADPTIQASFVPLIEAASLASGPLWTAVNPPHTPVAPTATAAAKVVATACADDTTLAWAQKLIDAVQLSAATTGWSTQALATDPKVQAAVVPLLVSTANVSGIQWDMVDGSALTAQKTAALQGATPGAMPGAVESFQSQQPAAATPAQPAALPQLPNIFGRKMQQVILNPLDAFGITTDSTKATPSTADAARLSAALGLQSAPPAQAMQWEQQQQVYKNSVRTSDPATIQNALKSFNSVDMNPSKLYAPGAPPSNNAPLTPQEAGTTAAPQAAPAQPATVVYGSKGAQGYKNGTSGVSTQVPAQSTQAAAQQAQATYQQNSGQAATPVAYSGASQAASSQAAGPVAYSGATQSALSQAAGPVAYSDAADMAASGPETAAAAGPATTVANSQINPGVLQRPSASDSAAAAAGPQAQSSSYSAADAAPVAAGPAGNLGSTVGSAGAASVTPASSADSSSSATGAQSLLSSLGGGGLADSPGVAPAPPGASYSWLQPNPKVTQVPASVVAAINAKAPRASPDGENVRQFVNQASFRATPGTTLTTQQVGAASGPGQQEQGRRLAEAPVISAHPASAQQASPQPNPSLSARLTNAFGSSATALLNAGANLLSQAPNPAPGVTPPSSDMVHLLGPAVTDVADVILTPAPAPAAAGEATSMSSEVAAAGAAHAPATSIEGEVAAGAKTPAVAPSAAAAALAASVPMLQGPQPPLLGALNAVAGLPGDLGLLPKLPSVPGGGSSLQGQQLPQGGPLGIQGGVAATSQNVSGLGSGRRR